MYTNEITQTDGPSEYPVFSTVMVEHVDTSAVAGDLNPVPALDDVDLPSDPITLDAPETEENGPPEPGPLGKVDPDGLIGSGTPAFILAIHAIDPPIGFDEELVSSGPGDHDAFDSVIGFTIRESGAYDDVEVPVFPIDDALGVRTRIPEGQVFPPNPTGDTEVVAQLWTPIVEEPPASVTEEEPVEPELPEISPTPWEFLVKILELEGEPIRDGATVTALDQNPDVDPITSAELD